MNLIQSNICELKSLFVEHQVDKMYAFGSVITARFNEKGDIDFPVKFKPIDLKYYFEFF